ncbi:hypothetical protein [Sphingopyxis sp. FD7]|uniref:hypothetical protein n=1 Tax=Sphingopyxis sp. FD7 TaxID=1914525 RepID=UPI000DC6391A|nr:hypothetical protein [Sphingopyxis sp. FD7]BBB13420.1 hypothetical protein SPYCA_2678 [Sphingopyxis sp. FD7]
MSEIAFIDVQPRRADTGAEVTVRLAGGGTDTPYRRNGENYHAGVVAMPRFRAAFGFDDNGWTGGTVPTNGEIGFVPGASSLMTELLGYYWRDAAVTIDAGEEGGALVRRLTGTVADVVVNEGQLQLTIADPSQLLDKPLLGAGFTGEGGIEGPSEATGRPKRRSWGRVYNVEGGLLDKANNIYEFGDPSKPIGAFDAVRDKGRAGAIVELPWQGSVAATFTALQAADAPDGGCVAAPSIACVKWWTVPAGPLTADIRGENSGGYSETAAGIVAKMLAAVGGPALADLAAAEALRPAPCGVHIAVGTDTVAQAIDRLLLGVSLYWVLQPDATIRIGEWAWGAPVAAFQAIFLGRERQLPPVKTRKVGYRRNHRVHSDSEISAAVILADDVSYLDGTPLEDLKPAEPGATDGAIVPSPASDLPSNIRDEEGNTRSPADLLNMSLVLTEGGRLLIDRGGGAATDLGQVRAAAIGAATEGAMRVQTDALDRLAAVVTQIDTRLARTQGVIRDAGIYVDPASGKVTLSAIDATAERINDVSVTLDAVQAQVALKATTSYVDNAIATAVIDPSQVPVFEGIEARLTSAEVRLDGHDASLLLKADAATVNALSATVTDARIDIDALQGAIVTKVDAATFNDLETRVATAEDSLSALGDTASIERGISVARLVDRRQEDEAAASLAALLAGDRRQRSTVASLALAREEITARLIDGDTAEAMAREALAARVGAAEGAIAIEQQVRSSTDSALATQISQVSTTVGEHSATIEQQAESIDGLFARYGVKLDVNGRVIGWVANNDGQTGGMDFIVDYLRIWDAAGGVSKAPFEFRNGGLYVSQLSVDSLSVAGGAVGGIVVSTPPSLLRSANDVLVGMVELPPLPPGTNAVRVTMTGNFKIEALAAQHVWARLREVTAAQAAAFKADPGATPGGYPALPASAVSPMNSDKLEYIYNVWDNAHLSWIDTAPESGQLYIVTLDALSAVDVRWKDVQISAEIMKRTQIT